MRLSLTGTHQLCMTYSALVVEIRVRSHFLTCSGHGAPDWLGRRSGETMQVLTDAQWAKFEAAIAAANIRGARPRTEERRTIEAIIWRVDNGAKCVATLERWRATALANGPGGGSQR